MKAPLETDVKPTKCLIVLSALSVSLENKDQKMSQRLSVLPLQREAPDAESLAEDTVGA